MEHDRRGCSAAGPPFFAAALFAVLGPTQRLGAFATYDAMALLLLAASAWCVVAARDRDDSTLLLVAGTLLLALANATKYATALFDPAVVALAALVIARKRGAKASAGPRPATSPPARLGLVSAPAGPRRPLATWPASCTRRSRAPPAAARPWLVLDGLVEVGGLDLRHSPGPG